jgi:hypothetical protein
LGESTDTDKTALKGRPWFGPFIEALRKTRSVTDACKVIGKSRATAFRLKKKDKEFAKAWDSAHEANIDDLEACMLRRAIEGDQVPIIHQGEIKGYRTVFPDTIQIFMAKHNRKEKYQEAAFTSEDAEAYGVKVAAAIAAANATMPGHGNKREE